MPKLFPRSSLSEAKDLAAVKDGFFTFFCGSVSKIPYIGVKLISVRKTSIIIDK